MTNLIILQLASGIATLLITFAHRRMNRIINSEAKQLEKELNTNMRLNTLIFHDINNPLTVLSGTLELLNEDTIEKTPEVAKELKVLKDMTSRISSIINSSRRLDISGDIPMKIISVQRIFDDLQQIFSGQLQKKGQILILKVTSSDLSIQSNREILINSVFNNFMSNAIKFSPRNSTIIMSAQTEDGKIRISIINNGESFPDELLEKGRMGEKYISSKGTEGELGTASGLMIAAMCLKRLHGSLEIRNLNNGVEVSALLH